MLRARIITASWDGHRTGQIAAAVHRHPKTVRCWLHRFNAHAKPWIWDAPPHRPGNSAAALSTAFEERSTREVPAACPSHGPCL
ncbi:helix-turn-helix domain-containing protein [Protofrankia coriariae]|uniref:helix-turn-helix domain-containing protein n=1 Tax=Protofrankia coriariae TaxID=1562887 RepID=UPI0030845A09